MMEHSIRQQTLQALGQLPPEGLEELVQFLEFLQYKYRLISSPAASTVHTGDPVVPPNSLTAKFQGMVQSPLSVAELSELYELNLLEPEA